MTARTPTHLKLLRGNPGHRRLPQHEPKPKGDLFLAPDFLSERQQRIWARVIATAPAGLLKEIDEGCVVGWVLAFDTVIECNTKLDASSLVLNGGTKTQPLLVTNPYERIRRQNILVMNALAVQMGFSPVSRSRIELMPPGGGDDDGWDEILNG